VNVAFSPDGESFVTATEDGTARVWNPVSGQSRTPPLKGQGQGWPPLFSPDGRRFIMSMPRDKRPFLETTTGQPLTEPIQGWAACMSADGRLLLATDEFHGQLLDALTGRAVAPRLEHSQWIRRADFSPDGRRVATASADRTARIWDVATGQPVTPPLEHSHWVNAVVFSPDGRLVATGSFDKTARVWDAATGRPLTPPMQHEAWVTAVAFSRDSRRVFTACRDRTVRIWEAATGERVTPILNQFAPLWPALFTDTVPDLHLLKVGPEVWDPPRDDRPVADLLLLAQVLAAHEVDPTGGYVPVKTARLQELWLKLPAMTPSNSDGGR
jgi:WD40 repeat protein